MIIDDTTGIQIDIPPGALADTLHIGVGVVDHIPQLPDSVLGVGLPYYFWPDGLSFLDPITVRIPYANLDFGSMSIENPDELMVYFYSTTRAEWYRVPVIEVDEANGYIVVQLTEFCYLSYTVPAIPSAAEDLPIDNANLPKEDFQLFDIYPNPFNPETIISYEVYKNSNIRIEVYNTIGQRIRNLMDSKHEAGSYEIAWDGRDDFRHLVGAGIYVVVVKSESQFEFKKVVFVK